MKDTSGDKQAVMVRETYQEPDCLRFCPSNSSDAIEISLSGKYPFCPRWLFSRRRRLHGLTIFVAAIEMASLLLVDMMSKPDVS